MAEKKDKAPKRPKARRAAAAAESGKRVKLLKDPSQMSPEDRVRYYLGLPQGYPMSPALIEKARGRLLDESRAAYPFDDSRPTRGPLTELEEWLTGDFSVALDAQRQDERSPHFLGEAARRSIIKHRPYDEVPFSQEAAEAHLRRLGFRDPGESLKQARARIRQEAAKPQNPRMGGPKRKHGTY